MRSMPLLQPLRVGVVAVVALAAASAATRLALLAPTAEANRELIRRTGQRIAASGTLSHRVTAGQPPEDLMLDLGAAPGRN
jgi:hypothetical protein